MRRDKESGYKEVAAEDGDELVQLNVRVPRRRALQAKRLATSQGRTMSAYVDHLLQHEIDRQRDELLREYDEQIRELELQRDMLTKR